MKNYAICSPENPNWCVPASLQTILIARKIEINQNKIAESFTKFNSGGFNFNLESLKDFLGEINSPLKCHFHNPHKDETFYRDCNLFLRDVSGDVLAAYDAKFHQQEKNGKMGNNHLSVLLDYNFSSGLIKLVEAMVSLPILVKHMNPNFNRNYGFYIIE